jgi:hypothetical protein
MGIDGIENTLKSVGVKRSREIREDRCAWINIAEDAQVKL